MRLGLRRCLEEGVESDDEGKAGATDADVQEEPPSVSLDREKHEADKGAKSKDQRQIVLPLKASLAAKEALFRATALL